MPRALDPEKRSEARRLRVEGASLNEIARTLGISYGSAFRFTNGVCPEKERSPNVVAKIAATKQKPHDEWRRTAPRGGCGTPGCDRVDCPIPYGKCHCGCGEDATRAQYDDRPRSWVRGEPHRYLQGHQRGGGTLMAAVNAEPLLAALERIDMTRIEVARGADLGKGVVADLIGLDGYRLRRAHCERIVSVLREGFERQGLDPSTLTLERLFTEERPANEPPVGERARRAERRRPPVPPNERGDGAHFRAAAEQLRDQCRTDHVWTHSRASDYLGVLSSTLSHLRDRGRIKASPLRVGPLTATVYAPADVRRLGLELAKSESAWDRRRRNPLAVQAWALTHGATPQQAACRAAQTVERVKAWNGIRVQGRPKAEHPQEWAQSFLAYEAELAQYARLHDEPTPARWHIALAVAEADFASHPERWNYPHAPGEPRSLHPDYARPAAQRVWEAVKPLLLAQRKVA